MSIAGNDFDWRAFWADLLSGAGRGMLELEGSDAARAALAGLDHLALARRRRDVAAAAARRAPGSGSGTTQVPVEEREVAEAGGIDPHYPPMTLLSAGLPPRVHAAPLSADPYDHPGLPGRVRLGQRPFRR